MRFTPKCPPDAPRMPTCIAQDNALEMVPNFLRCLGNSSCMVFMFYQATQQLNHMVACARPIFPFVIYMVTLSMSRHCEVKKMLFTIGIPIALHTLYVYVCIAVHSSLSPWFSSRPRSHIFLSYFTVWREVFSWGTLLALHSRLPQWFMCPCDCSLRELL